MPIWAGSADAVAQVCMAAGLGMRRLRCGSTSRKVLCPCDAQCHCLAKVLIAILNLLHSRCASWRPSCSSRMRGGASPRGSASWGTCASTSSSASTWATGPAPSWRRRPMQSWDTTAASGFTPWGRERASRCMEGPGESLIGKAGSVLRGPSAGGTLACQPYCQCTPLPHTCFHQVCHSQGHRAEHSVRVSSIPRRPQARPIRLPCLPAALALATGGLRTWRSAAAEV